MKKFAVSVALRAAVATALCFNFILYPQLRVALAKTAPAIDLKSESQYKTEAARYDAAVRAIAGIASMKLETAEDLKQAHAILDPERPNLQLLLSKFVVMALSDATFTAAVKKKAPDKQSAEAFIKALEADPQSILKLDGAAALQTRMRSSAGSDAETLKRAGERLKEAAAKVKQASSGRTGPGLGASEDFQLVRVSFSLTRQPATAPSPVVTSPQFGSGGVSFVVAALSSAASIILDRLGLAEAQDFINRLLDAILHTWRTCQETADARLASCIQEAERLPSRGRLVAIAECEAQWLFAKSICDTLNSR